MHIGDLLLGSCLLFLGIAIGYNLWRNIGDGIWWLRNHVPTRCAQCGTWVWRQEAMPAEHRAAGYVWLCQTCHDQIYGRKR